MDLMANTLQSAEHFAFCVAKLMLKSSAITLFLSTELNMIAVSENVNHTVNHTPPFFALKIGGDCVDNGFIFFSECLLDRE